MTVEIVAPVAVEAHEFWHSVDECLPVALEDVLVVWQPSPDEPSAIDMAYRTPDGRWSITGSDPDLEIEPSHWMALPALPEASC